MADQPRLSDQASPLRSTRFVLIVGLLLLLAAGVFLGVLLMVQGQREPDTKPDRQALQPDWGRGNGTRPAEDTSLVKKLIEQINRPATFDVTDSSLFDLHVRYVAGRSVDDVTRSRLLMELSKLGIQDVTDPVEAISSGAKRHLQQRQEAARQLRHLILSIDTSQQDVTITSCVEELLRRQSRLLRDADRAGLTLPYFTSSPADEALLARLHEPLPEITQEAEVVLSKSLLLAPSTEVRSAQVAYATRLAKAQQSSAEQSYGTFSAKYRDPIQIDPNRVQTVWYIIADIEPDKHVVDELVQVAINPEHRVCSEPIIGMLLGRFSEAIDQADVEALASEGTRQALVSAIRPRQRTLLRALPFLRDVLPELAASSLPSQDERVMLLPSDALEVFNSPPEAKSFDRAMATLKAYDSGLPLPRGLDLSLWVSDERVPPEIRMAMVSVLGKATASLRDDRVSDDSQYRMRAALAALQNDPNPQVRRAAIEQVKRVQLSVGQLRDERRAFIRQALRDDVSDNLLLAYTYILKALYDHVYSSRQGEWPASIATLDKQWREAWHMDDAHIVILSGAKARTDAKTMCALVAKPVTTLSGKEVILVLWSDGTVAAYAKQRFAEVWQRHQTSRTDLGLKPSSSEELGGLKTWLSPESK